MNDQMTVHALAQEVSLFQCLAQRWLCFPSMEQQCRTLGHKIHSVQILMPKSQSAIKNFCKADHDFL